MMKKARIAAGLGTTGAADRNRTGDLLITNQLLYQLSYSSEGANYSRVESSGATRIEDVPDLLSAGKYRSSQSTMQPSRQFAINLLGQIGLLNHKAVGAVEALGRIT